MDDIILMITNPDPFLPEVQQTLQRFSNVSYYKVNNNKSYILDLGIDATVRNLLQAQYSYVWVETDIIYLGVQLTRSTKILLAPTSNHYLPSYNLIHSSLRKHE